jgi:DNA-binding MarR family transcriptional regulator
MKNVRKKEVIIGLEKAGNSTYRTITDAETGELIDEGWLNKTNKKPGRMQKGSAYFVKLYKTNLTQIVTEKAKEKRLSLDEAGLLFMLLAISGWQTPYIVNPYTDKNMSCSEIADFLNKDRKHIQDLLDRLISKGMISKIVNGNGRSNFYMLNPNVAFYGKTIDDTKHLDVFKTCPYEPKKYIDYRKTPDKKK